MSDEPKPVFERYVIDGEKMRVETPTASELAAPTGSDADVPVLSILKRHLETSVQYQQVASKVGNPEGYAYVKIPDWEVRQIIEFLERQNSVLGDTHTEANLRK